VECGLRSQAEVRLYAGTRSCPAYLNAATRARPPARSAFRGSYRTAVKPVRHMRPGSGRPATFETDASPMIACDEARSIRSARRAQPAFVGHARALVGDGTAPIARSARTHILTKTEVVGTPPQSVLIA